MNVSLFSTLPDLAYFEIRISLLKTDDNAK